MLVVLEGVFAVITVLSLIFSPVLTTITPVQILGTSRILGGAPSIFSLLEDRENAGWKLPSGIMGILVSLLAFMYPPAPL